MAWIQIKIAASDKHAERISEALMGFGAVAVTFQDTHDNPVYEPLPGETLLWNNTDIIGLFDAEHDMQKLIKQLKHVSILRDNFNYKIEQIEDKDWERAWMDNFHPMQFGQRLWICPSWREAPDPTAVNVLLDPGLAFGTGTHPTTSLCLQWLDGQDLTDKTVIDFGCGSGILAIAALKLGAKSAIGIDIDPQAIIASLDNAKRNGVDDKLTLYLADDAPSDLKADFVLANILAGPLKELAPNIKKLVNQSGFICLSGVLSSQAEAVAEAYQDKIKLDEIAEKEEWCRITGQAI